MEGNDLNTFLKDEEIEVKLLLNAIFQKYGYDFRNYSPTHVKRRLKHRLSVSGLEKISDMIMPVMKDESFFNQLLLDLSINVTEMFRDPTFYAVLRKDVIPILKTFPIIKIWHAGCSSGEEVYSMAILLKEEGLLDRTQIYATDFNQHILKKAQEAIYSVDKVKTYTKNYIDSGGQVTFSNYYDAYNNSVKLTDELKKNIVFANHNLVSDGVFGEMNIIICRNVLIYFNKVLQNKVIQLFSDSLIDGGILCLGSKESLRFTKSAENFNLMVSSERIYEKKY